MIHEMKSDLEITSKVCKNGRQRLENAKQGIATEGFLILSQWKLKKKYAEIATHVSGIVGLMKNIAAS